MTDDFELDNQIPRTCPHCETPVDTTILYLDGEEQVVECGECDEPVAKAEAPLQIPSGSRITGDRSITEREAFNMDISAEDIIERLDDDQ